MKLLVTAGMTASLPGFGDSSVYASIFQVTGYNLGMNLLFGLVPVFSVDFCCTMCYATNLQMQTDFYEELYQIRTPESYTTDLEHLLPGMIYSGINFRLHILKNCLLSS